MVAALTGSALGGGYELAMACHHRIALNDGRIQLGLPEVKLGVIPGAGGTQRLPRMIGIQAAPELMSQGRLIRAPRALPEGLVDALADTCFAGAVCTGRRLDCPAPQRPAARDQGTSMRWVGLILPREKPTTCLLRDVPCCTKPPGHTQHHRC